MTYKISAVDPEVKNWSGAYGAMKTYTIKLEGDTRPIQINQKPETPAPTVGQALEGDIETGNFPDGALFYKFKKTSSFGGKDYTEQLDRIEQKLNDLLGGQIRANNSQEPQENPW